MWAPVRWEMFLTLAPLRPRRKLWCWGAMSSCVLTSTELAKDPARCSNNKAVPRWNTHKYVSTHLIQICSWHKHIQRCQHVSLHIHTLIKPSPISCNVLHYVVEAAVFGLISGSSTRKLNLSISWNDLVSVLLLLSSSTHFISANECHFCRRLWLFLGQINALWRLILIEKLKILPFWRPSY